MHTCTNDRELAEWREVFSDGLGGPKSHFSTEWIDRL